MFLKTLPADEIEIAVNYLSGEIPQGKTGIAHKPLRTAADPAEALKELGGEAAFEWKMDGARIQAHKVADEVRIYTRSLNALAEVGPASSR